MKKAVVKLHEVLEALLWLPALTLLGAGVLFTYWTFDRSPPSRFLGQETTRAFLIVPGQIEMTYGLERVRNTCDVTVNRWISFRTKFRYYFPQFTNKAKTVQLLADDTPGEVRVIIDVPNTVEVGDVGAYGVQLEYACNPVQKVFPIEVNYVMSFVVEPRTNSPRSRE